MKPFIQRTVSEIGRDGLVADRQNVSISNYHATSAWVLLGDAGSGKTRQFEYEVEQCNARGESARYITARDFVALEAFPSQCKNTTIYIDALDEVRATRHESQWYFDLIRRYLHRLGKPKFRIACRDADWLGKIDHDHLTAVSADSKLVILRLDGLQTAQIQTHLSNYENISDVNTFIEEARHHGVERLLANPQNLDMLAQLVTRPAQWPTSRFELYSSLCEQMTLESNPQHGLHPSNNPPSAEVLAAAGQICSLLLLTDRHDCITTAASKRSQSLTIEDFPSQRPAATLQALATRLFQTGSRGGRTPVHRSIAEFLAARHLAHLIKCGLPVQRILALVSGSDGMVITPFRGLSAWLATHSTVSRTTIIKKDPIGVALYADLTRFSTEHKKILLDALFEEIDTQTDSQAIATIYGRVVTPELSSLLEARLNMTDSSPRHLHIVKFVLVMLCSTANLDPYTNRLIQIVEDNSRPYDVRVLALRALIQSHRQHSQDPTALLNLLSRTHDQVISDHDGELTGELLSYLYPRFLAADSVIEYLHDGANDRFWGAYQIFWTRGIVERSQSTDAAVVLNSIAANIDDPYALLRKLSLYELPFRLLLRALPACTDTNQVDHLFSWLQVTSSIAKHRPDRATEEKSQIRDWIEARPNIAMHLIDKEFQLQLLHHEERPNVTSAGDILMGATPPQEFGRWCLQNALEVAKSRPVIAVKLLLQCYREFAVHKRRYGLTLRKIQDAADVIGYIRPLAERFADQPKGHDPERSESSEIRRWVDQIRNNRDIISDESRNSHILHVVGRAYFGLIHELDDITEIAAVRELLEWDMQLLTPIERSLLRVVERNDLPSVEDVIDLFGERRHHVLGLPFLASVDYALIDRRTVRRTWSVHDVARAVAFHYAEPYLPPPSSRIRSLLNIDPETTISTLTRMVLVDVRTRRHVPWRAWTIVQLLVDPESACRASFEIVSKYPLRCTSAQVEALDSHLWAILPPGDDGLGTVACQKLSTSSLDLGQRVRWLLVGVLLNPEKFIHEFERFIAGYPRRITHLATFLCRISDTGYGQLFECLRELEVRMQLCIIRALVRTFGKYSSPRDQTRSGWVDSKVDMSRLVTLLVEFIATIPSREASSVFEDLCGDPTLFEWEDHLLFYREYQSVAARDAQFIYPSICAVNRVLDGGSPANPADLHALVVDQLSRIGESYRVHEANFWKRFWNEDSLGRPSRPKVENSCRDLLVADLLDSLPSSAEAIPEARFVHDNRADALVQYGDSAVSIKIKIASNRSVWVGLRDQLIEKYGKHRSTWGYGIYTLLWFGSYTEDGRNQPVDLDVLQSEVVRMAGLSDAERSKVAVVVLDLSVPKRSTGTNDGSHITAQ